MKVLILSVTAGQGHNSTAKALQIQFESMGVECQVLDTLNYLNKLLGETVSKGYLLSVENAKTLYKTVYHKLERREKNANHRSAIRLTNMIFLKKMKRYIGIYAPDIIICTHPFVAIIVDIMIQQQKLHALTVGVVTDFAMHPFWEESLHFDYIVTASEWMTVQAVKKGFRPEQVLSLGIPIHPKFAVSLPKEEARRRLGLEAGLPTLLMMSGSMGYGNIVEILQKLDALDLPMQILTVCGNNADAKARIDELPTRKKVLNFGFIDYVELLMDAADCIVTKPGGLTTSEALAKNLPMLIVNPIPGQEERNTEFLLNTGAAMAVNDMCSLEELVRNLFTLPGRLEAMRDSIRPLSRPQSTANICQFAVQAVQQRKSAPEKSAYISTTM